MKCPQCGAENPEKSWQCLCGHYFAPQQARTAEPITPDSPPVISAEAAGAGYSAFATAASPAAEPLNATFGFHGDGSTLFGIYLANVLFTMLTLGVYYFWGKAKVRRYVYGQTAFAGDRFDYHGTGKELLIGWLKAALLFGGVGLLFQLGQMGSPSIGFQILVVLLFYAAIALIIPIAIVGTQRYRLSRTSWRSIRFSFRGHSTDLMRQYVRDVIFLFFTLSLYYPFFQNRLRTFLVGHSYFGSQPFDYDGEGWDLFRLHIAMLLLIIPTLGLYWFWYTAQKHRYYWGHTRFGQVRFRSIMQGGQLALLKTSNLFLIVFTLGLGYPWAVARSAQFNLECLSCSGPADLDAIFQQAMAATATGEGFTEMLDASILDIDFGF